MARPQSVKTALLILFLLAGCSSGEWEQYKVSMDTRDDYDGAVVALMVTMKPVCGSAGRRGVKGKGTLITEEDGQQVKRTVVVEPCFGKTKGKGMDAAVKMPDGRVLYLGAISTSPTEP